jgi:hypothetical protein
VEEPVATTNNTKEMGYQYLCRSAVAALALTGLAVVAAAQHTLIKRDGHTLTGQVMSSATGQLTYTLDPGSGKNRTLPCGDVLVYIDEALVVHTDPCEAANRPKPTDAKSNCASLIRKDNSVVKGNIIAFMEDYIKIRTLTAEKNEPLSDIVGQLTQGEGVIFQNEEYARKLMADQIVVRAVNDIAQCPSEPVLNKPGYSLKQAKAKFDVGKKKAALAKAGISPGPGPVVTYKDTVQRGLLEVLDFDTFKTIALTKVERLGGYIGQLSDKKISMTLRDKVIGQALALFERPESNTVQVSRLMPDGKTNIITKKVMEYLRTSLRFNKYDNVKIKWADLNYTSDFEEQPDGSYVAVISVQQQFTGIVDGVETYSDVTNKNVTVTLRSYEKFTDGGFKKLWDVFLGDIGVSSTQPG